MNQERYSFLSKRDYLNFEFDSHGPNGRIRKIVRFSPENAEGVTFFSLAFGHLNEATNELDDRAISNNQDTTKILATVAATVVEFTAHFPDMAVFAQGSSPARTRLYQMSISTNLREIETIFDVYGSHEEKWERFRRNVNYNAFYGLRKKKL